MTVVSIGRMVSELAARDPARPAITHEDRTVTRAEFDRRTNRLARAYEALGVKKDDFVTIALPNGIEFYEAAFAAWKLGATPGPVSARLPRAERQAIIELARPSLVVGADPADHPGFTCLSPGFEPDPGLANGPLEDRVAAHWKAVTSGGSTGRPKLIVDHNPSAFDPDAIPLRMAADRAQLVPGPLYHNGPFSFSMRGLLAGNHIVVMTRFDAEETLRLIGRHRIDWVMLVPTMMSRIWKLGEEVRNAYDLSSLRIMLHLAAPCPPWLKRAWIDWLGPERIHELYAGTEAIGGTWITGEEWLAHEGSVGRFLGGTEVKILDEEGNELPPGEIGEVWTIPPSGAGTTYHYLGAEPKRRTDGWESLGDMGYLDEEGYLYLADRQTDMILSGGANIYPAEIEAAIDAYPAVRSSAVIGLPDEDMGNLVHAIVDVTAEITEDELRAHLAERLVRYKVPRTFEFVSEPLRDDAGKTRRSRLRVERIAAIKAAAEA